VGKCVDGDFGSGEFGRSSLERLSFWGLEEWNTNGDNTKRRGQTTFIPINVIIGR
jgi:hypothetical protein